MKLLLVGASGFLGAKMLKVLGHRFEVCGTYTSREKERMVHLDVTDVDEIKKVVNELNPDVIVYVGGMTGVDYCEQNKKEAWDVNVTGTKNLIDACGKSKFVYISTDFVFDGARGNYSEHDVPNPVNYYGLTKLEGEKLVMKLPDHLILRVARLYGYNDKDDKTNFVRFVIENLRSKKTVKAISDQYGCPTLIDDIAIAVAKLIENNKKGLYHCCGSERVSMYGFARKVSDVFGLDSSLIIPVKSEELAQAAKRPTDASMNTDKIKTVGVSMSDVHTGLLKMKEAMK